ncbi:hypothetical protein PMAYCL1PPCAC_01517, partial [Pristionchus mayeri]
MMLTCYTTSMNPAAYPNSNRSHFSMTKLRKKTWKKMNQAPHLLLTKLLAPSTFDPYSSWSTFSSLLLITFHFIWILLAHLLHDVILFYGGDFNRYGLL